MDDHLRISEEHVRIENLRGIIIHLDEVLTMSAKMAAATNDLKWEKRYRKYEIELDAAIKEAIAISSSILDDKSARMTDSANIKLVAMENQAFELISQNRAFDALTVLNSDEYNKQKVIYSKGMAQLDKSLHFYINAENIHLKSNFKIILIAILIVFPLLMVGWIYVFRIVNRWEAVIAKSNIILEERTRELALLNRSLDNKVIERTKELEYSKTQAIKMKETAERAKQKAEQSEKAIFQKSFMLGERIKELNCLIEISKLKERMDIPFEGFLRSVVDLIPPAWQYPDITAAKISINGTIGTTDDFGKTDFIQSSDIMAAGSKIGIIEVCYLKEKAEFDEGPFLKEERHLLDTIAREIADYYTRLEVNKALSASTARYMAMINTVPAIMYIEDIDHCFVEVNQAFCDFVGKPRDEIIGKNVLDLFPEDIAEQYHQDDKIAMDEDRTITSQEKAILISGKQIKWIASTKVPLHDRQGSVEGVVGLIQDVTENHFSREQLMQTDKLAAIGTLAAGVAHEINNPIGFINSNLNTMDKYLQVINKYVKPAESPDTEEQNQISEIMDDFKDAIAESMEGTERVKKIVADLKSFSRVDKVEKDYACINEGLESTLNIVWNELKYKCTVEKDFGNIPEISCMANQLNQVFMNLLINAGQAISESGTIYIKTWAEYKNIFISIRDTGQGIPPEKISRIFEPFFTTKDVGKGTGLGLSLSYDIIQKHGGDINVHSDLGIGTEFIISLPMEGRLEEQHA
ncbi:MAG: ATP-binding protein [candidate division Zixibacteria bacterium]